MATGTLEGVGQSHPIVTIIDRQVKGLVVPVAVEMVMIMGTIVQVLPIVTVVVPHQVRGLETLEVQAQGQGTRTSQTKGHIHLEEGWPGHISHGLDMVERSTVKIIKGHKTTFGHRRPGHLVLRETS